MRQIIYHDGPVRSMCASPVGNNIITGSQDGTAVVYILQAESEEDNQESESISGFKQIENITTEEENDIYKLVGTYLKDGKTQVHYVNNPKVVARTNNTNSVDTNASKEDEFTIETSFIMERMRQNQEDSKKEKQEEDEDLFTFNLPNTNSDSNANTYTSSTSNETSRQPNRELTTIRVSNFPSSSVEEARRWLSSEFADHGNIQRINLDSKNIMKNGIIGYVTYYYKSCAERAVEVKNGARVGYQVLCVELIENRY
jgi:hypothetical protein